jgi:hypothetical protein
MTIGWIGVRVKAARRNLVTVEADFWHLFTGQLAPGALPIVHFSAKAESLP